MRSELGIHNKFVWSCFSQVFFQPKETILLHLIVWWWINITLRDNWPNVESKLAGWVFLHCSYSDVQREKSLKLSTTSMGICRFLVSEPQNESTKDSSRLYTRTQKQRREKSISKKRDVPIYQPTAASTDDDATQYVVSWVLDLTFFNL